MKTLLLSLSLLVTISSQPVFADLNTNELLDSYHSIQSALSKDAYTEAQNQAGKMITPLNVWLKDAELNNLQRPDVVKMLEGTTKLSVIIDATEQRLAFGLLSEGTVEFIRKNADLKKAYQLFFCPMVSTYAFWVQPKSEKIANPYMGTSMPTCGSKKPW